MKTTHLIFKIIGPRRYVDTSTLHRIDDQPIEGFKNREVAKTQLDNLLTENKPPYAGGNQFVILETFYK